MASSPGHRDVAIRAHIEHGVEEPDAPPRIRSERRTRRHRFEPPGGLRPDGIERAFRREAVRRNRRKTSLAALHIAHCNLHRLRSEYYQAIGGESSAKGAVSSPKASVSNAP